MPVLTCTRDRESVVSIHIRQWTLSTVCYPRAERAQHRSLTQTVGAVSCQKTLDYILRLGINVTGDVQPSRQDFLVNADGILVVKRWVPYKHITRHRGRASCNTKKPIAVMCSAGEIALSDG